MEQLDLDALCAPIEDLRGELKEAYKQLDAKWAAVAERLKKLPIPCTVSHMYWEHDHNGDCSCLEWRKWSGSKRICVAFYPGYGEDAQSVVPYDEWSGQMRLDLLKEIPAFFDRAEKQTRDFIKRALSTGGAV